MASGLIVLAEDDSKLRRLYSDALTSIGFFVLAAEDGARALSLCLSNTPKLVILDIMMPVMDGVQACREIRKLVGDNVPIVFLTALDDLTMVTQCIECGGDDYLVKSTPMNMLLDRVRFWAGPGSRLANSTRRQDIIMKIYETGLKDEHFGRGAAPA